MLIIIFCICTNFKYRFDSSDVKQNFISEIKHFVYELSQELHQEIRLENRKYFENGKNDPLTLAEIKCWQQWQKITISNFSVPIPFYLTSLSKSFIFLERFISRNTSAISHTYLNDSLFFLQNVNICNLKNDKSFLFVVSNQRFK